MIERRVFLAKINFIIHDAKVRTTPIDISKFQEKFLSIEETINNSVNESDLNKIEDELHEYTKIEPKVSYQVISAWINT